MPSPNASMICSNRSRCTCITAPVVPARAVSRSARSRRSISRRRLGSAVTLS